MSDFHRAARAVRYAGWAVRTFVLVLWYRLLFPEFRVGRGVRFGRGVYVNVVDGGSLHIGEGSNIEAGCQLVTEGELRIGPRAFVGTGSVIVANQRVIIGCDALIAAYVTIRDDAHKMEPGDLPYNRQGLATAPIDIGNNVWLGTKATVLRGVSIGDGAVVAAHAVVRSHVEARTLVGGIPAKLLRKLADRSSAGPAN